jgi:hypothetical protein
MGRVVMMLGMIALGLASCGGTQAGTPQGGTPQGSTPIPAASSSSAPPSGPAGATGVLRNGRASVTLTGDLDATIELSSLAGLVAYAPAPGGFAIGWSDPQGGSLLTISGQTFTGERATSDALTLSLDTDVDGAAAFASAAGECTIEVATAEASSFAGSFSCTGLASVDGQASVDAEGTFEASG